MLSEQTTCIKSLYQDLIQTHKQFHSESLSASHFELALKLSEGFLDGLKRFPNAVIGQFHFPKKPLPDSYNFGFNAYLLTALLCVRNKINDTCSVQLISAVISLVGLNQRKLQRYFGSKTAFPSLTVPPSLIKALRDTHYDVWVSGCTAGNTVLNPAELNVHNPLHNIVFLALHIARLATPGTDRRCMPFAQALRQAAGKLSSAGYPLLDSLLSYPTLIAPGTLVKLSDGALCRIVAVSEQGWLVKLQSQKDPQNPFKQVSADQIVQCATAKPVAGFGRATQLWDEAWMTYEVQHQDLKLPRNPTFRLDSPPQVLLDVQASLEADDADVGKIARHIEKEPSLAAYLTLTATQSNRQKLHVSDVRHGLMMHGFERTRSLLIQQALVVRLNQHIFPLQDAFLQFCRLFSHLASTLISVKRKSLCEPVSALAYFAATGLFTLPALKGQTVWRRRPNRLFDLNSLVSVSKQGNVLNHSVIMTKAWQQPASYVKAIGQHNVMPDKLTVKGAQADLAVTLGLSAILSRQVLFDDEHMCPETRLFLNQAMVHLGLTRQELDDIREASSGYCHVACSISA